MEGRGAALRIVRCDVTDDAALTALIREIAAGPRPLAGVFHAAGVIVDALTEKQDAATLARVMAPKAVAAQRLHELTRDLPLDHFVLFASVAGAMGSVGQGPYAAANAALDALAHARRAQGLPALSIDWGLWDGGGMAAALSGQDRARLARRGIHPMPPDQALAKLGAALSGAEAEPQLLIGAFGQIGAESTATKAMNDARWKTCILAARGAERDTLVGECLRACVAEVLDMRFDAVSADDNLFQLGFDSLMVMDVVKRLKQELGCTLYPRELYQTPVVGQLADYLAREVAKRDTPRAQFKAETADSAAEMAALAFSGATPDDDPIENPVPAIGFILSAPRSGSTLLRVMLAGHPRLFAPPELHLLPFKGMADRAKKLAGSHLDEGLTRALMELRGTGAAQAQAEIAAMIEADTPVQEVYRILQAKTGGRRLIDKSPSYAAKLDTVRRAERLCDEPRYVHLVRHPLSMIDSFMRQRMDRLIGLETEDPLSLAETIWRDMNRNIRSLTGDVGDDRCLTLRYEDLVMHPEEESRRLCDFLHVEYDPALLDPYAGGRMTDGVGDRSLSVGDPNFKERQAIDSTLAEAWREVDLPRRLHEETAALARAFGYEEPARAAFVQPARATDPEMREETVRVSGLDLTVCRWGAAEAPAVFCMHGILEQGAVFRSMAVGLLNAGYQVIAPDLRGHGLSAHCGPSSGYHLSDFVTDLDAIVRRIASGPVTILGVSLGAAVATLFAAVRPEVVNRLILVEPPVQRRTDTAEVLAILRTQLSGDVADADRAMPDLEAATKRLTHVLPKLDADTARWLAARGTEQRADGLHWRWDARLRSPIGVGFGPGQEDLMLHLTVPYVLVFGQDSDLAVARDWRSRCNGKLIGIVELPGGHHLHFDAPGQLCEVVLGASGLARRAVSGILAEAG